MSYDQFLPLIITRIVFIASARVFVVFTRALLCNNKVLWLLFDRITALEKIKTSCFLLFLIYLEITDKLDVINHKYLVSEYFFCPVTEIFTRLKRKKGLKNVKYQSTLKNLLSQQNQTIRSLPLFYNLNIFINSKNVFLRIDFLILLKLLK